MKLSVIIPAYNEQENILETIKEIREVVRGISPAIREEIIVVDDHSSDETFEIVSQQNQPNLRSLRLSRRSGSHAALRAGLFHAEGDAVVWFSADGQDNPACLPSMIAQWKDGTQVVWAVRPDRQSESLSIRGPAKIFYRMLATLGGIQESPVDLSRAEFCLMDKRVVASINACNERNTSLFGLIIWVGYKQSSVEYDRRSRRAGRSKWNFSSRLRLAQDWIVAFSGVPLKLMTVVGFVVAAIGFLYAIIIFFNVFFGHPVTGWPSTMVVILVLGGIQMMMLGVMGEYLWRNLDETRRRPLFFVEKKNW